MCADPTRPIRPIRPSRREFLGLAASCAAHIALLAQASPAAARTIWQPRQQRKVVAEEPWGRIEQLADGVWSLVSTPLQDRKTLSNGAIIAGSNRVLVVEAFGSTDGAKWLAGWAQKLTGKPIDEVVVTHYHGDHTAGISAFAGEGDRKAARLRATPRTAQLVREDDTRRNRPADAARTALLQSVQVIDEEVPGSIDLGRRTVHLVPRGGHTASDVSIELEDPRIVIAGDLLWNRMFPNYVDAQPSLLARSVWALGREPASVYVPGHGPLAEQADFQRYVNVLGSVEAAARRAHERGTPAADAAKEFTLPASLGEWTMFSPRYFEVALGAWEKELKAGSK
jgi:glyoxylase-like metal-dependent hydrolase (beta-lactamase superfamily II)